MSFQHLRNGQNELVLNVEPDPSSKVCNSVSRDTSLSVEEFCVRNSVADVAQQLSTCHRDVMKVASYHLQTSKQSLGCYQFTVNPATSSHTCH